AGRNPDDPSWAPAAPRLPVEHGQRESAHADQIVAVVDVDLPDVRPPAAVEGAGRAGDVPAAHGAEVVGVDLDADAVLPLRVGAGAGGGAADGLGQGGGGAAVEQAERLVRPVVDGHRGLQIVRPDLGERDAQ